MATSNTRDVKMTLSVETLGTSEVDKLRSEIERLAKEGGDAAPEFQRLAEEVGKLGQQAETLRSFQQLADATAELVTKQEAAQTSTQELATRLQTAQAATQQAAQTQREAASAYDSTQRRLTEIAGELSTLRATYDAAGKKTDEYKDQVTALIAEKTKLKTETIELRNERNRANQSLTEAENAEKKLQTQYDRSLKSLDAVAKKLSEAQAAQQESATTLEQLGLSTTDVAQAQAQLVQALNQTGTAAREVQSGIDAVVQAERELAQQAEVARQALEARNQFAQQTYERDRQIAEQRIADEQRRAAAEKAASDAAIAARRAEQAEFDRLFQLQEAGRARLEKQARDALLAEQAAQRDAAQVVIGIERQKQAAIEQSARAQAEAISNAFETVGARGANELRAEIDRVRAAMNTLSTQANLTGGELRAAMAAGNAELERLQLELRRATDQLTLADRAAELFSNSMGQIAVGNLVADGLAALIERVKELARQFIAVIVQTDTFRRALNAIYKDAETTTQQMTFLRNAASVAGVSIANITNDFIKFSAATKASNIPLETTNQVFMSVVRAAGSLGLSADKTSLALNALGQIASKGVVSMEELRQQLGDSIPGALSLTAKGLGITDSALIQLVESGELAARDFFPAFAEGLKELQGETDGLRNTWERFKNTLTIAAQGGEANGTLVLLTGTLKVLGGLITAITLGLSVFAEALFAAGKAAIVLFESFRGNGRQALEWFNEETQKSIERLTAQANAMNLMLDPSEENQRRFAANAVAQQQFAEGLGQSTSALKMTADELVRLNAEAQNSQAGQQALAIATKASAAEGANAGQQWVGLTSELNKLRAEQEQNIATSEKKRIAIEREAEAIRLVADLRGDELGQLEAEATAAAKVQGALEATAQARQNEADILAVQLKAMTDLAIAQTGSTAARQSEINAIAQKLEVAREEAAASAAVAQAARVETAERQLAIQTYRDNSAAIEQFKATLEATTVALQTVREAEAAGLATKEQVRAAEIAQAEAAVLYNDALKDRVESVRAAATAEQALLSVKNSNLQLSIAEVKAQLEVARARGENAKVMRLERELRQLELQQLALNAEAKRAESRATRAQAEATRASQIALNQWTPAAEAAFKASVAKAEALENEAKIADITINKLKELATITKQSGNAARSAATDYDNLAESLSGVGEAADSAARSANRVGSDSGSGSSGSAGSSGGGSLVAAPRAIQQLRLKQQAGTLSESDLELAKQALEEAQFLSNTAGAFGFRNAGEADDQLVEARRIFESLQSRQSQAGTTQQAAPNRASQGFSVSINLNGSATQVNTASQRDAENLVGIFRQLESASGRTF